MDLKYSLRIDSFGNMEIIINLQSNALTYKFTVKLGRTKNLTKEVDEIINKLLDNDFSKLRFHIGSFAIYDCCVTFGITGFSIELTKENKDIFIKLIEYIKPHICIDNEEELKLYNETISAKDWIDYNYDSLKNIKNQTFELCKYAIDKYGFGQLKYIKNHTIELCKYVIDKNISAIKFIRNPTDEIKLYVIDKAKINNDDLASFESLSHIKNISENTIEINKLINDTMKTFKTEAIINNIMKKCKTETPFKFK